MNSCSWILMPCSTKNDQIILVPYIIYSKRTSIALLQHYWVFAPSPWPDIRTSRTSNSKEPQPKYRLGTISIKIRGGGGNPFNGIATSPFGSVALHYKCNITHITHNNKEYELCKYYNTPLIKFVTVINKMNHNISTVLERGWGGGC